MRVWLLSFFYINFYTIKAAEQVEPFCFTLRSPPQTGQHYSARQTHRHSPINIDFSKTLIQVTTPQPLQKHCH